MSCTSFELAMRSSRDKTIGLISSAVDKIAFSMRFSVPKSTFKHFGFEVGQRIPCKACRVSIASLKLIEKNQHCIKNRIIAK